MSTFLVPVKAFAIEATVEFGWTMLVVVVPRKFCGNVTFF